MYFKISHRVLLGSVCAALLSACVGGGGSAGSSVSDPLAQVLPASGVMAFINDLIGNTSDEASPIEVGALTLSEDDSVEPTAVP